MKNLYHYYRKKKSRTREDNAHVFDSSSVGDLAFLLLIFFIVTSSFILRQGIFLSLPPKSAGSTKVPEEQIVNIYPTNNSFSIEGVEFTRNDLIEKLKLEKMNSSNIYAVIHMRDNVKYDRLVDALSVAKESGITRISLRNVERK